MKLFYTRHHDGSWTVSATYRGRYVAAWSVSRRLASQDAVLLCHERYRLYDVN